MVGVGLGLLLLESLKYWIMLGMRVCHALGCGFTRL